MKLEISVHALKLKNVAGAFKGTSDPFAILTQMATTPGAQPQVLGKTEIIKNNLNPVSETRSMKPVIYLSQSNFSLLKPAALGQSLLY